MSKENFITKTNDGYVVEIFAKTKNKIDEGVLNLSEGVSILEPKKNETEEEQFVTYKEIAEKMEDRPIVIKAIDTDITTLKCQFRAILRAGIYGDISIAIPKIVSTEEMEEVKTVFDECKKELDIENIQYRKHTKIGAIIEIPSSALMSYDLAKECDFFYIDTDSLTNYCFGGKTNIAQIPQNQLATIKLIRQAVKGAHDAGIFCGICGEMVENELYIPLLLGLGIDEFTMETKNIQKARETIQKYDRYDCKEFAKELLDFRTLESIEYKLKEFVK